MSRWWTYIAGATKYAVGRERSLPSQTQVAGQCASCPMLVRYKETDLHRIVQFGLNVFLGVVPPLSGWCGNAGEDQSASGGGCGCLVLAEDPDGPKLSHATLTVDGRIVGMSSAGKTTRAAEKCPLRKWGAEAEYGV